MTLSLPPWYGQLKWSKPHLVKDIDRKEIPLGSGLYVYTAGDGKMLTKMNVLYVGKADGSKQTLRYRISVYLRHFDKPLGYFSKHAGMNDLRKYYSDNVDSLYVRWAGVLVCADLEGFLIDYFDPPFNHQSAEYGPYDDDWEKIPDHLLY